MASKTAFSGPDQSQLGTLYLRYLCWKLIDLVKVFASLELDLREWERLRLEELQSRLNKETLPSDTAKIDPRQTTARSRRPF